MKTINFIKDGINPKFTLNRFVVGASKVAFESAKAVAKKPGKKFNPLFICSEIGNGKTHLMHAIGNELKQNFPKFKVLYVTAEQFFNDFIESVKNNSISDFKNKYTKLDCLLLDDVQSLIGKEQTQEQIFNIFNTLKNNDKQIVIASNIHTYDLEIEERLKSMFKGGLAVDIYAGGLKTREDILRKKAEENGFSVPDDVILFIAEQIETNHRDLEGILLRVISYIKFTNTPFTLEEVKKKFMKEFEEITKRFIKEFIDKHTESIADEFFLYGMMNDEHVDVDITKYLLNKIEEKNIKINFDINSVIFHSANIFDRTDILKYMLEKEKNKFKPPIYFSALLKQKKYLSFYNRLVKLFEDNSLSCKFVEGTKDIWMRDFMPIKSTDDKYIQFDYHPKYLEKYPKLITDGSIIAKKLGIDTIKTDIKLDGGNFVCRNKTAIITSRIFKENPQYKEENLIDKIKDLLKLNKIIIIEEEYDTYGHSDGMVRFVDDNTVLINEYLKKHIKYKKKLTDVLEREGLKYIEIPSTDNMTNAIGLYINYLQFDNIIIVPKFNIKNDNNILISLYKIFGNKYKILQIDCTEIAKDGGVLNCISWQL